MQLIEAIGYVCLEHPHVVTPFDVIGRLYSSHSVTTSRRLSRTTVWYLAIPSCLVVSVFNGVMPGWAFEQSIRGRPATFPDSARQWNSFAK